MDSSDSSNESVNTKRLINDFNIEPKPDNDFIYEVLNSEKILQEMTNCIKEVATIIQIPFTVTRILLNQFKWDKDKLYEDYFDGDRELMFRKAQIIDPYQYTRNKESDNLVPSASQVCGTCFTEVPSSCIQSLICNHRFCIDCWEGYLKIKIMDEGMGHLITCQACETLVEDEIVLRLIRDYEVKLRYQHLITDSFVKLNRLMKWCPHIDCKNAIKVQVIFAKPVTCSCGHKFCFQCEENWHGPISCSLLEKWQKKCKDESETSNWIAANTKECPKCKATIEKEGGCNHVICKNQTCKADFCWVCLGPWEPHGAQWFKCNRYNDEKAKAARSVQRKSRANLQRYLFYCNRYMNHTRSLEFETRLYEYMNERIEKMEQQQSISPIELQFLNKAVDILCQCRETLMYSYIFAYYLQANNQATIFEENQRDLESATEKLSEYLEREIDQENLLEIKQKVQDIFNYCEKRQELLLEHIQEGYDQNWWQFIE